MAQPKKQKSARKTGFGRNHILEKLVARVNGKSPVKVRLTKRLGKKRSVTKRPATKTK